MVTSYQNRSKDKLVGELLTAGILMLSDVAPGGFDLMAKGNNFHPTHPQETWIPENVKDFRFSSPLAICLI